MRSHADPHARQSPSSAFAGYRFSPEVITLAVRWYLRFGLSYRDVEELLADHRPGAVSSCCLGELRRQALDPPVDRDVVDLDPALAGTSMRPT